MIANSDNSTGISLLALANRAAQFTLGIKKLAKSILMLPLLSALSSCGPESEKPSFSTYITKQTAAYGDLASTLELIDKEGKKDEYVSRLEKEVQIIMALKKKLASLPAPTAEEQEAFYSSPASEAFLDQTRRTNASHLSLKANDKSSSRIEEAMSLLTRPL